MVTCENVNWKSLGRSLLAVVAENLLKKQLWGTAVFLAGKTALLPLVAGEEKSSGATATATEKVAPAGEQRRYAQLPITAYPLEWSLEPKWSRSRILHFYTGAGAEPEWQFLKKIRSRTGAGVWLSDSWVILL